MPRFEMVPVNEALVKTASEKQAEALKEYLGYIEQLKRGEAGRLQASAGESIRAVRRRLGAAAKLTEKNLVIKRAGDDIYFWIKGARRGRRGKTTAPGS